MAKISIKNLAYAIYESSVDKEGSELDSAIEKSAIFIKDKNLLSKKKEILKALEKIIDEENGVIRAKVSSKDKLVKEEDSEIESFIKQKYKAKTVIIDEKEDRRLLGGVKIEIGDDIIDTTLSNKINQLQNYLIKN